MNLTYYWINIDNAIERNEYMKSLFDLRKIKNVRIPAITPQKLNDVLDDKPPFFCGYPECRDNNCIDCPIEYSVLCSHFEAIKEGYKSGEEYFIVCEDDIYFPFEIDFKKMLNYLPDEVDIIQMMVISANHTEIFYNNFYKKNVMFINHMPITPSAAFYLISRKAAEKLLNTYINKETGKYNFTKCKYLKLADVLIFQSSNTAVSTFPLCVPNIHFKSQIHEHHYEGHKKAYEKIQDIINITPNTNPFIIKYYPCDDFEKLFKS
jgi:GR25 family glycosyltransferase involved in LPS biosynthesis